MPRRVLRWVRWLILAVLLALILPAAVAQWWLLPRVDHYRELLATALSDYLQVPVQIGSVAAAREDWEIGLRLQAISLQNPNTQATVARFSQGVISLALWRSLREWRPVLERVRLEGAHLTLDLDGTPQLLASDDSATATALPEFARWLFALPRLEIVGERWSVRQAGGVSLQLIHPYLQFQKTETGQRLNFTAELPRGQGDRLELTVERLESPDVNTASAQGRFQLQVARLDLAGWPLPLSFASGRATLRCDGEWQDWLPLRLQGQVRLEQAALDAEPHLDLLKAWLARWSALEAQFSWDRQEKGWELQAATRFNNGKEPAPIESSFKIQRSDQGWQAQARGLRAQDLVAWTTPWLDDAARRWLLPLDLQGALPEIALQAHPELDTYSATIAFHDLSGRSLRGLPGFNNLKGALSLTPAQGRIEINSRQVRVDTNGLLRAPILLDRLAGIVDWQRSATGLRLDSRELSLSNPDLNGRFWGSVTLPDSGPPGIDLQGHYWDVSVAQARRYLPVAVIPAPAVAWLDQALVGGRVVSGDMVFRGPPSQFPFDHDEGLFETRFQVENAILDYMPGWPRLERGQAVVLFRNRGLHVTVDSGQLLDGVVETVATRIEDLADGVIQVKGRARGPSDSMWRALGASPVGQAWGEDLPNLRLEGNNTLDLELLIPLGPAPIRVQGRAGLLGNKLKLPGWSIELERLRGDVQFTEASLKAEKVQALWRGEAMQLDLNLAGREGARELQARLRGRLGLQTLMGEQAIALEPYLSGKSVWEALVTVPTHRQDRAKTPAFTLALHSDLRGMKVELPAPLGKSADEARWLKIDLRPSDRKSGIHVAFDYSAGVRALLALNGFPQQPQVERGELRINAGTPRLPEEPGLTLVANLPRWSLGSFSTARPKTVNAAVAKQRRRASTPKGGLKTAVLLDLLHKIEIHIGDLLIGSRPLGAVNVAAGRLDDELLIQCDGKALAGRVIVPDDPNPLRPVKVMLQRLHLGEAVETAAQESPLRDIDPRQLPPLAMSIADLRIGAAPPSQLQLAAVPTVSGTRVTELSVTSEAMQVTASGQWRWIEGSPVSELAATIQSPSLGQALAALGYANNGVDRGQMRADLEIEWPAGPPDLEWERWNGALHFQVGPGQLRDINPGLGRFIGMLSVKNLARRLNFDFSDLFQPGMSFDHIAGDFILKQGQAQTDNVVIEAPAARIEIRGRIGLQAHDFDKIITVIPHVGGALPVAGTIAGGPVVGAAVLVAEQLLKNNIERATRFRYALKGAWDNPVIEYLQDKPSIPADAKGFASDNSTR